VSTLGVSGVVLVYDSKYSHLTSHTELQIASLIHTPRSHICVKFIDVPTQSGDSECEILAIAYATALSLKEDPGKIEFAESGLRNHLYKCLKNKKMTMFPVRRREPSELNALKISRFIANVDYQKLARWWSAVGAWSGSMCPLV